MSNIATTASVSLKNLVAYRSGTLNIEQLIPSEQHISILHDAAVVSVLVQVTGKYNGLQPTPLFALLATGPLAKTGHGTLWPHIQDS